MLVVISIISILASMLLPALAKAKEKGLAIKCMSNLHQLGLAMTMYGDDSSDRLPISYASIGDPTAGGWNGTNMPWTQSLGPYYDNNLKLLDCPGFSSFYKYSTFNYFMGSSAFAYNYTPPPSWSPASVIMRGIMVPSMYPLSGDCNYPTYPTNADINNNESNVLFALPSPTHNNRVNILFADFHVKQYKYYNPSEITFNPVSPGINWQPP
jgi:prepilin-type processing-associated H-X9-DG protein